ncbi:Ceramide kinase [Strongyloides ratti]|uniref:Ceramide kinase n=1 Tax=Strongyloides ratti TaxID=34506 RepID=A0A090LE12_STRRB|nr:Ceramide kinase [Strongyloides ratti]CEF66383.1 Ceramide kinase [Strongyloides ratti]
MLMDNQVGSSDRTPLTTAIGIDSHSSEINQVLNVETLVEPTPGTPATSPLPKIETMRTTIKSTDGQNHEMELDTNNNLIIFRLLNKKNGYTDISMTLNLSEVLCVRNKRIPMKKSKGLPFNVVDDQQSSPETPNSLFLYYAHKINVYKWRVREIIALFPTSGEKKAWVKLLTENLKQLPERPKKLVIFVNPFGGKGKAKKIYDTKVEPFFKMVGIECNVILTERANHAFDLLQQFGNDPWETMDGVVSVGGDGLFNEVLCSTVMRAQKESGKNIADINVDSLTTPRMRFGIIGAGSANSIVSTVHGIDDVPTAAIHIAIGSQCTVDVCTVHEDDKLLRISANAISYGWLGDVLSDSENYRWMGPIRYQWSALRTTAKNPSYRGMIKFKLNENNYSSNEEQMSPSQQNIGKNNSNQEKARLTTTLSVRENLARLPKCSEPCKLCETGESDPSYPYHLTADFSHIICAVIPCVSPFTPYGIAPYAGINDGSMDLAMIPKVSRINNLDIMRKVAMYGGRDIIPSVHDLHAFRVSKFSFTPGKLLVENDTENKQEYKQGSWNLDGEIMVQPEDKTLHFRLHPRLINYFGRCTDLTDPRYKICFCCHKVEKKSNIILLENDN